MHVSIFLESSKTYPLCQGAWIVIVRSGQAICPVKALERYIAAAKIGMSGDSCTFVQIPAPIKRFQSSWHYLYKSERNSEGSFQRSYGRVEDCCT